MAFDRKRVWTIVPPPVAMEVHPALCIGRKGDHSSIEEKFVMNFIINQPHISKRVLSELVDMAIRQGDNECLLEFFQRDPVTGCNHSLTKDEMKSFDFSRPWKGHVMVPGWDNHHDVIERRVAIVF